MSKFNPKKLSVEFKDGVTYTKPINKRKYTLTHSDITGDLFLTIGLKYDYEKINKMRDEVLGEWVKKNNGYHFHVYLYVGEKYNPILLAIRNYIFRRELPLALKAIKYGDKKLFRAYPELNNYPIMVHFKSSNPYFNKVEYFGTFADY